MDASKLEPPPYEGDTNNSETLDHAMLVSTHTPSPRAAHTPRTACALTPQSWPPGAHTNLSKSQPCQPCIASLWPTPQSQPGAPSYLAPPY
eukprot:scaffold65366_cov68-Phaeocystis_antarctica.AAC.1